MIDLYFGETKYSFPSRWDELTPSQYLSLVALINRYLTGDISMFDIQCKWFISIAGLKNLKVPQRLRDRYADNVMTAARQFDFFYRIDYGGQINDLSPSLRRDLRKTPPDELAGQSGEIRYARTLDYTYIIDAVWAKNLLPTIEVGGRTLTGWSADIRAEVLSTTVTASQFTIGYDLLIGLSKDPTTRTLALLVALLYGVDVNDREMVANIEMLPPDLLQAIVLNFQAFAALIFAAPHYAILWNSASDGGSIPPSDAITVPFSDSIYRLCRDGYGDVAKIESMPVLTYLNILRADMIRNVQEMAASGIKVNEIADRMHLPFDLILKML